MVALAHKRERDSGVPRHVAVIMDGNGRWARNRALPRQAGHKAGIKPVRMLVEYCAERGVEVLTLFAFSSENWARPRDEISALMTLFVEALNREVAELDANDIRMRFIGQLESLGPELNAAVRAAEQRTSGNRRMELVLAVAYGGRWDLVQATRTLAREVERGRLAADDIDESRLEAALATAPLPPVDLLIRSGGEQRISNFLLWDLAYSELYYSNTLWPDFTKADIDAALDFYAGRQRRFGRTGEQIETENC